MHVLLILQLSIFVLQAATTQAQNPSPYPVTCERTSGNSALHKKTRATIDSGRKQPNARSNFLALNSEFFRIQRCPSIPLKKKNLILGTISQTILFSGRTRKRRHYCLIMLVCSAERRCSCFPVICCIQAATARADDDSVLL
jgi:hypothetical protein